MDSFHIVEWANAVLDDVRIKAWRDATAIVKALEAKLGKPGKGKTVKDDRNAKRILDARKVVADIKGSAYAVGKNPEYLTDNQRDTLKSIRKSNARYYRAYEMKESLRLIMRCKDRSEAEGKLKSWLRWGIPFQDRLIQGSLKQD